MATKVFFFYLDTKIDVDEESLTGARIKEEIENKIAEFDPAYELVLEGRGAEADKPIANDELIDLSHGHGDGPRRFFSRPPTSFGV